MGKVSEIGHRAAEYVHSLPGGSLFSKLVKLRITPFEYSRWINGEFPRVRFLNKLTDAGADLHYILTGRRVWE